MYKERPLVSILCTAYMHQEYIAQTLDSFLMQETDFPFEILVSDDASADGTAQIIEDYAARYPDVIRPFIMKENIFSQGRNFYTEFFFPQARGKYICLCEGDDYWTDPGKLQMQADFLEEHPEYSACVHDTMLHYCGSDRPDEPLLHHGKDMDIDLELIIAGASRAYHTSSFMARAKILTDTQPFYHVAYSYGFTDHANALWLRLNGKIRYFDKIMSVYRINSGGDAWSSGVDGEYEKLRRFVTGELEMFRSLLLQVEGREKDLIQQAIIKQEFELMYIEGRDKEQRRPPYRQLLKQQPWSYRMKNFVKSYCPGLQQAHRRRQGYGDK